MCVYVMYIVCVDDVDGVCVCVWRSDRVYSVSSLLPLLRASWGSRLGHQASITTCWAILIVCHFSLSFLPSGLVSQRAK